MLQTTKDQWKMHVTQSFNSKKYWFPCPKFFLTLGNNLHDKRSGTIRTHSNGGPEPNKIRIVVNIIVINPCKEE